MNIKISIPTALLLPKLGALKNSNALFFMPDSTQSAVYVNSIERNLLSSAKKRKMSLETIGDPGDLKKLVKTSLEDRLDTGPDQGTCEDALMPILAENSTSSPEQDVSPDQKEEVKANTKAFFRKTFTNKCHQALVRNVHGPRTCIALVSLLQNSHCFSVCEHFVSVFVGLFVSLCLLDCLFLCLLLCHTFRCRCHIVSVTENRCFTFRRTESLTWLTEMFLGDSSYVC